MNGRRLPSCKNIQQTSNVSVGEKMTEMERFLLVPATMIQYDYGGRDMMKENGVVLLS